VGSRGEKSEGLDPSLSIGNCRKKGPQGARVDQIIMALDAEGEGVSGRPTGKAPPRGILSLNFAASYKNAFGAASEKDTCEWMNDKGNATRAAGRVGRACVLDNERREWKKNVERFIDCRLALVGTGDETRGEWAGASRLPRRSRP